MYNTISFLGARVSLFSECKFTRSPSWEKVLKLIFKNFFSTNQQFSLICLDSILYLSWTRCVMVWIRLHSLLFGQKYWRFLGTTSIGRVFSLLSFVLRSQGFRRDPNRPEGRWPIRVKFGRKSLLTLEALNAWNAIFQIWLKGFKISRVFASRCFFCLAFLHRVLLLIGAGAGAQTQQI